GVDPSPTATRLTAARPFHLRAAADRLPFPTGAFDVVLCTDVLAHVPEAFVERTLREMLRVAGGPLVAAIDCANPTRDGHTTMRPRQWWLDKLAGLGATPDDGFAAGWLPYGTRLPEGLELIVVWPESVRPSKSAYELDLLAA
ncbi:MAG: methyltransferase domain-containing protein, partial [Anaerolineae bacterium]|nr:methyltransferase domain-containing protein [Anaerolineae bacterium]